MDSKNQLRYSHMVYPRAKKTNPIGTNSEILDNNCSGIDLCLQIPLWQSQSSLFCLLLQRNMENPVMCI